MTEQERAFLERLRSLCGAAPFIPMIVMDEFHLSELPPEVHDRLVAYGPGHRTTKALTTFLRDVGAVQTGERRKHGYLWRLP